MFWENNTKAPLIYFRKDSLLYPRMTEQVQILQRRF